MIAGSNPVGKPSMLLVFLMLQYLFRCSIPFCAQ